MTERKRPTNEELLPQGGEKYGHSEYDRNQYSQYEYLGMQVDAPEPKPVDFSTPYLDQWKTSVGGTVAGILVGVVVMSGLTLVKQQLDPTTALVAFEICCALLAIIEFCGMLWAVVFYPKLYSNEPLKMSNTLASATNGFFGGVIFGLLWNHCLTKGTAGISHILYAILMVVPFAQNILDLYQALPY